jgi:ABC-type glycerol-3-phosphate transport system substrate-binding protein
MKKFKRLIAAFCTASLLVSIPGTTLVYADTNTDNSITDIDTSPIREAPANQKEISYHEYLTQHRDAAYPEETITIKGKDFLSQDNAEVSVGNYAGRENVLLWDSQEGTVTWEFTASQQGFYSMSFIYCPIALKSNDIQMGVMLDGYFPFANAKTITLPRLFLDETYNGYKDWDFEKDNIGNELRPKVKEVFDWQTYTLIDTGGQYNGELMFYLTEGKHTLTIEMQLEALAIDEIKLSPVKKTESYEAVKQAWDQAGAKDTSGFMELFQAEKSYLKSSNNLFATYDKSNFNIMPSDPYVTLYNTIGKNTWDSAGEYITWEFEVPQDGYYHLSFKVKQNTKRGMYSVREMMIDGSPLFEEMRILKFKDKNSWYIHTLSDENNEPYRVYLTGGKHILKLMVTIGDLSDILIKVDEVVGSMNDWYREIVKITGINPDAERVAIDTNRDFMLDAKIPGLMDGLRDMKGTLEDVLETLDQIEGISKSSASVIAETIKMLDDFIKKPGKIASRIETYRNNMSSLASWTVDTRLQPLEIDYFAVYSPDMKAPKVGKNIFKQLWYRLCMLVHSFFSDENVLGSSETGDKSSKPLRVWISTSDLRNTGVSSGRDQAMLLKRMIDEMFTSEYDIPVELSLVNSSDVLTQAVLAGKGPDVALFVSKETPVNLAMRGALLELSSFDDFEEVTSQFMPSAMIPYKYRGKYYAFPQTQSYDMLFYRTDVFAELGLTPPDTWDEFYAIIPVLMDESYLVGIPENQRIFEMFLYQNGGKFYNDELTKTAFHEPQALKAFEAWTGLYAKYSLPLVFDFFNRFRNGEMPMAIMPYTEVNYLAVAAPELKNLWDIAPIPGTPGEDGTINRASTAGGTACILLADTKQPDNAYKFLKWWVSADAQSRFGVELEQNLGAGARYPTANVEAFEKLPWTKKQAESLMEQWKHVTDVQQIPGSYYIARNIGFAFRDVVYENANERETLYKYNIEINKEITRKQKEFELSTREEKQR